MLICDNLAACCRCARIPTCARIGSAAACVGRADWRSCVCGEPMPELFRVLELSLCPALDTCGCAAAPDAIALRLASSPLMVRTDVHDTKIESDL